MSEYKSTVMRVCIDSDEDASGCPVCAFLLGKRDEATLMAVIAALDDNLAAHEESRRALMRRELVAATIDVEIGPIKWTQEDADGSKCEACGSTCYLSQFRASSSVNGEPVEVDIVLCSSCRDVVDE